MSPPQKSEVTVPPVNTSSQASIKEAEGSLEDIPANISLIAALYSSRSVSPLVDPSELQANANRAIDNMLHLKRSLDIKRQKATWELGVMLCQNEFQGAASIAAAKAIYSEAVLEAKTNFQATLLVGPWVIALPSFSCSILLSSPPKEVVLHGVALVHLSCV